VEVTPPAHHATNQQSNSAKKLASMPHFYLFFHSQTQVQRPIASKKKKRKEKKAKRVGTNSVGAKIPARMSFTRTKLVAACRVGGDLKASEKGGKKVPADPNTSRLQLLSGPLKLNWSSSHPRRWVSHDRR